MSTPVTWDEVEAAADGEALSFEAPEVLERVDQHGDLFAATLEEGAASCLRRKPKKSGLDPRGSG